MTKRKAMAMRMRVKRYPVKATSREDMLGPPISPLLFYPIRSLHDDVIPTHIISQQDPPGYRIPGSVFVTYVLVLINIPIDMSFMTHAFLIDSSLMTMLTHAFYSYDYSLFGSLSCTNMVRAHSLVVYILR